MAFTALHQLHTLIGTSLSTIERVYAQADTAYPSLDDVYQAASPGEQLLFHPEVAHASALIISAAEQIIASVKSPQISLCDSLMAYQLPAALAYAERLNVVEALNDAGPSGMHLSELANITGSPEGRLEQVMRLLATHYIFREVQPCRFINNRLSSLVDTGHPFKSLPLPSTASKYRDTSGSAAFVALAGDEMFKAAAFQTEAYIDSPNKHSLAPSHSAFSAAFGTDKPYFEWLSEPANSRYLDRFRYTVLGVSLFEHPTALNDAFPWGSLPIGGLVVDVGGGMGPATLKLVTAFPHLKYLIQDLPPVVVAANDYWARVDPEAWNSKRVRAVAHNFFEPQPIKDAAVFLIRAVCHDHGDDAVIKILSLLRAAAQPGTALIIGDHIMPYACPDTSPASEIPGAGQRLAPPPLLANLGKASATAYYMGMTMQTMFNGKERTLASQVAICKEAGWNVQRTSLNAISRFGYLIAYPM